MRRWIPAAIAMVALTGCGAGKPAAVSPGAVVVSPSLPSHLPVTPSPSPSSRNTPAPTPTPPPPRSGTHRVDVDGDGRLDTATLSWIHVNPEGTGVVRLTVRLATGAQDSRRVAVFGWMDHATEQPALPWAGASRLLAGPGHQVVIGVNQGAHAETFTVWRWANGRLAAVPAPTLPGGSDAWTINSSVGTGEEGYACTTAGLNVFEVGGFQGPETTYSFRWTGGRWRLISTKRVTHPKSPDSGGWYDCVGLAGWW